MAPERFFGQPASVATAVYELAVIRDAMLATPRSLELPSWRRGHFMR